MARRELQEINAGSMADIAFLLLIFFLVTTTMDKEKGIVRMLPPKPPENVEPPVVKERNVFIVLANKYNQLLVEGKLAQISELREMTKEFYTNPTESEDLPVLVDVTKSKCEAKLAYFKPFLDDERYASYNYQDSVDTWEDRKMACDMLGSYRTLPKAAVISLKNDRSTAYETYIQVNNELEAAIRELRDELCLEKFGKPFSALDPENEDDKLKITAVRQVYPKKIMEAQPVETE